MINIARISDHERFQARETPKPNRGSIQVEDGYTRTANAIVEAFARSPLTSREARVVRVVERMTYGWNKAEDWIAASVIEEMTGISEGKCSETLNGLIRKKVLTRNGGGRSPVRINKNVDEWDFSAQKSRVTPKRKTESNWGDSPQDGVSERPQNEVTPKDIKDTNTDTNVSVGTANAEPVPADQNKKPSLPCCPHMNILDLWAEVMPEKRQHSKNLWSGSPREKSLAARWKAGFRLKRESDGKPFYTTRDEGIEWWGRFFKYLRRCDFLMDNDFVDLEWVCRKKFFDRILERKYENKKESQS